MIVNNTLRVRPFLKWPGGKYRVLDQLNAHIPQKKIWVEPFVGAGSVFLNTNAQKYYLNDINADLVYLYQSILTHKENFIASAKKHFQNNYNNEKAYYRLRKKFNQTQTPKERAMLFLFLNRFGFNGLCRYNSSGIYNVPFGHYKAPYFPENEMRHFYNQKSPYRFYNECFELFLKRILRSREIQEMVIYCDPPYAPLPSQSNFTKYASNSFTLEKQEMLAILAKKCAAKGAHVLISNHDTPFIREQYQGAHLHPIKAHRSIGSNPHSRKAIIEVLAHFKPE